MMPNSENRADANTAASIIATHDAAKAVLPKLQGDLARQAAVIAAFRLAALHDTGRALYWPDLMEALAQLAPEGDSVDCVLDASAAAVNASALARGTP